MQEGIINGLRQSARKLIRELGVLQLNMSPDRSPQHWHTLIEISNEPNITICKLSNLFLLSPSSLSRIVKQLEKEKLIIAKHGPDKREKYLEITEKGREEIKKIDEYSRFKIKGALDYLSSEDQGHIIAAIEKYADALEKSRICREKIKINTLSTSRTIRKQVMCMIEFIQKSEFNLPITDEINQCVMRAEDDFYFNRSYNFWYATSEDGRIIGSIGLKKINTNDAEIKKFFVAEQFRGKGVSRKLFQVLLKAAIKHRFKHLYLGTVDKLHAAHRFYEKYGFSRITESDLPKSFIKCPLDTLFFKVSTSELKNIINND